MENWLNCRIDGFITWPSHRKKVIYNGYEFILLPDTDENDKSLHLNVTEINYIEGMTIVNRFTSLLSWKEHKAVQQVNDGDGTAKIHSFPIKETYNRHIASVNTYPDRIDGPTESSKQLSLSLYREGLSINSIPYKFLSFFKILNIKYKDKFRNEKNDIKDWISRNISKITDNNTITRMDNIQASGDDITDYAYNTCRCAIAHANTEPIVDPDNIEDVRRINSDLCIIRALSKTIIKSEFKISDSLWE